MSRHTHAYRLLRWLLPLAAGICFAVFLALELFLRLKTSEAGIINMVAQSMNTVPTRAYVRDFSLGILLPFYAFMGLLLWMLSFSWGAVLSRSWSHEWRASEGFFITLSALLWAHLVLWWEVPSTLWTMPGIRRLPFWLIFLLLGLASLAYPLTWAWKRFSRRWVIAPLILVWMLLWTVVPRLPEILPRWLSPANGGTDRTEVLMIGLDALRQDVGQACTESWEGRAYEFAYTPIPATRLLWHILWGGEPLYYTVGHAPPAVEEFGVGAVPVPLPLLEEAKAKGWKPRFYIDDGGTIGLTGRASRFFDDALMPAAGWENFVNSNLAVNFPLYASWENWARAFPTTNPWAPLDAGLKEALRQGRGSKWVMFHSCLAHQPIYLKHSEIVQLPKWWTAIPHNLEPMVIRQQATPKHMARWDPRGDPFRSYEIRMKGILESWKPLWNGLAMDPMYGAATRVLFSDHGERFYHVTDSLRLAGIHGYDLDPWEARVMLKMAGPAFGKDPTLDKTSTVSLLGIRDAVEGLLRKGTAITPDVIAKAYPQAPLRYHVLSTSDFTEEPGDYLQMDTKDLLNGSYIAPNGVMFMQYGKPASERAKEVSVGIGEGSHLQIIKPLVDGGAHRYDYEGFVLKSVTAIDQKKYESEKARIEALMKPLPTETTH